MTYVRGVGGSKPEVLRFPGACHKHFRIEAQAKAFIQDWIEMFACVAKANIKRALLDGHRPFHMQEWCLQYEVKVNDEDIDHNALVDGINRVRLVD